MMQILSGVTLVICLLFIVIYLQRKALKRVTLERDNLQATIQITSDITNKTSEKVTSVNDDFKGDLPSANNRISDREYFS